MNSNVFPVLLTFFSRQGGEEDRANGGPIQKQGGEGRDRRMGLEKGDEEQALTARFSTEVEKNNFASTHTGKILI